MRKTGFFTAAAIVLLLLVDTSGYAASYSSTALINNAKLLDGKKVTYRGEAIGDVLARGEHAWVAVNDGSNAISIWIKMELARFISSVGNYKRKGDIVEVTGIFNNACAEHGGDLDIHALTLRKLQPGGPVPILEDSRKNTLTLLLLVGVIVLWVVTKLPTRKHKK